MSDPAIVAISAAVVSIVATVFGGIMTYMLAKLKQQGELAAVKVDAVAVKADDVKVALKENNVVSNNKLDAIAGTGDKIHQLVNSSMLAQLRISKIALRRIADLTKHADDIAAADVAEKLCAEHDEKQKAIDTASEVKEKDTELERRAQ